MRFLSYASFLILVFSWSCSKKEAATPVPAPITYAVSGKVVAPDSTPLGGVQVLLTGGTNTFVRTGPDGRWTADKLQGSYMVQALSAQAAFLPATIEVSGARTGVNFVRKDTAAPVPYTVGGKVVGPDGQGMVGVLITLTGPTVVTAQTDANGRWTVDNLHGAYIAMASAAGSSFLPQAVTVTAARTDLDFARQASRQEYYQAAQVSAWLAQNQRGNGLVTSTGSTFVSLYDQGLAALAFMAVGDNVRAERIFDYFNGRMLSEFQVTQGGFYQFRDAVSGVPTGNRWLGDNAWLLIALNHYAARVNATRYSTMQTALTGWIRRLQNADGGLSGGYQPNGGTIITGTEGLLDAYFAVPGYDVFHSRLLGYFRNYRWSRTERVLYNEPLNSGSPYRYAMDCFSWAYCMIDDFPASVLTSANRFVNAQRATRNGASVLGYAPDPDKDVVWLEGTGQMVVAFQLAGDSASANLYLQEMRKMLFQDAAGANTRTMPYATNRGTGYGADLFWQGVDTNGAISSCTWYLYAVLRFDPFAVGRGKNVPVGDRFW